MVMNSIYQRVAKWLVVMIISQMVLMNLVNLQNQSVMMQTGTTISTPCPKSVQLQSVANKLCKAAFSVFVDAGHAHVSFYNSNEKLFFLDIVLLSHGNPIYSIDKPPKY